MMESRGTRGGTDGVIVPRGASHANRSVVGPPDHLASVPPRTVVLALWSVVVGMFAPHPLFAQPYRHTLLLRLVDRDLNIPLECVQVREVDSGAYGVTDENGELT